MKYLYIIFALLGFSLAATSCTDNDYTELDKGNTELKLLASASEVVLSEKNHSSEAVELAWTTGTNYGSGSRIKYTLELAQGGTDFASPVQILIDAEQEYSWKPTVEQLNDIAVSELGVAAGQSASIDARVIATVANYDQQVASTQISVATYKPVTDKLYLIGDATPNGWSADNATEMTRTDNGVFTWTGDLTAGSYKFITTLGSFLPSYNNGGNGSIYFRDDDAQSDEPFTIEETHCYKIDVNLLDLTITCTQVEGIKPPYENVYFVGNENGWGFTPMSQDAVDPFLFRIGLKFSLGGEFKFGTTSGSWENMYKATEDNAPYTSTGVELVKGFDPDKKWFLKESELSTAYKICLDIRTGKERMIMTPFTPYECIYLVGDATPNGWDLGNATAMTVDATNPYILTWSGHLNAGEMKFSADKQSDWNGAWFFPDENGKAPTGDVEKMIFINKSDEACQNQYLNVQVGALDHKWKISEAGDYTITLNQLTEEVTIAKK